MNTKVGDKTFAEWYENDYVPIRGADEGEGEGGDSGADSSDLDAGLFPGIDKVPAEYRQHIDPILKEVQKNANSRISELSEKTKSWEPYEQLGVQNIDPETMEGLIGLVEVMAQAEEDPAPLQEWWEAVGKQYGFAGEGEEGEGEEEELFEGESQLKAEDIAAIIQEQVSNAVNPLLQQQQEQQQEKLLQEADNTISEQLSELKKEHGDFDEKVEAVICKLALAHDGPEAIQKGFEDYKSLIDDANGELFSKKENQPGKPEGPGTPDTTPDKITNFKDANAAARARLEQMSQS